MEQADFMSFHHLLKKETVYHSGPHFHSCSIPISRIPFYSFLNSTYDFGIPHFLIVSITMHYNDNNIFKFYLAGNVQFP